MNARIPLLLAAAASVSFLAACANTEIEIHYKRPPEMDIPDHVKRLGVVPFDVGNQVSDKSLGDAVQGKIETALVKSAYYQVITRSQLEVLLKEQKLNFASFAEGSSKDLKIKKVDGMIIGSISQANSAESRGRLETLTMVTQGPPIPGFGRVGREVPKFKKVKRGRYITCNVAMSFQLIDYTGGGILIASESYNRSYNSSRAKVYKGKKYAVPPEELPATHQEKLEELIMEGVENFLRMITPHEVTRKVELVVRDQYTERGVKFAERNLVKEALEQFDLAIQHEQPNDAAFYDKGVMLEVLGRYEEALEAFKKAYYANEDDLYLDAMERMKSELQASE